MSPDVATELVGMSEADAKFFDSNDIGVLRDDVVKYTDIIAEYGTSPMKEAQVRCRAPLLGSPLCAACVLVGKRALGGFAWLMRAVAGMLWRSLLR